MRYVFQCKDLSLITGAGGCFQIIQKKKVTTGVVNYDVHQAAKADLQKKKVHETLPESCRLCCAEMWLLHSLSLIFLAPISTKPVYFMSGLGGGGGGHTKIGHLVLIVLHPFKR